MERRQRAVGLGARKCALRRGSATQRRGNAVAVWFDVELARFAEIDCESIPEWEKREGGREEKPEWNQAFELLGATRCS